MSTETNPSPEPQSPDMPEMTTTPEATPEVAPETTTEATPAAAALPDVTEPVESVSPSEPVVNAESTQDAEPAAVDNTPAHTPARPPYIATDEMIDIWVEAAETWPGDEDPEELFESCRLMLRQAAYSLRDERRRFRDLEEAQRIDDASEGLELVTDALELDDDQRWLSIKQMIPAAIDGSEEDIQGLTLVAIEQTGQKVGHGFDDAHDDAHTRDELAMAAACYILPARARTLSHRGVTVRLARALWPFALKWWKPAPVKFNQPADIGSRIRDLTKGAALAVAEIDRLLRRAKADAQTPDTPDTPETPNADSPQPQDPQD